MPFATNSGYLKISRSFIGQLMIPILLIFFRQGKDRPMSTTNWCFYKMTQLRFRTKVTNKTWTWPVLMLLKKCYKYNLYTGSFLAGQNTERQDFCQEQLGTGTAFPKRQFSFKPPPNQASYKLL